MRLRVSPEVHVLGLHHPRIWRLTSDGPLLAQDGLTAEQAGALYDARSPIPEGYRKLLAALGHAEIIPAGERLRELVRTRGWASHGAVVDAVTVATLRHGAGVGLHRTLPTDGQRNLVITRASGHERITPAFTTRSRRVPAGDLIYGTREPDGTVEPFAWLGRRDCDSAARQLTPEDSQALLVVLGCPGEGAAHSEAIGTTVAEVLAAVRPDVRVTPLQDPAGCTAL
ncbi:hypothetical protein QT196_39145 (plasmid) [Streptomyces sp. P9-2B-2]|uniref:hypothetical protein n=1 Tax=Streptomyces sp. P9-2B-2 TaxID=3057114 RepID=UPI0025B5B510|nr:hypothetical protein [Streptomyces sp. P9-2B-2]WJY43277.1 hypothetical protein QT196_39145 [Streptomyces sp. P9-2B-2]